MSSFYFHAARMYVYKANAKGFDFLITKYIILTLTVKIKWMGHKSLLPVILRHVYFISIVLEKDGCN